jgi:hypothetical protein
MHSTQQTGTMHEHTGGNIARLYQQTGTCHEPLELHAIEEQYNLIFFIFFERKFDKSSEP